MATRLGVRLARQELTDGPPLLRPQGELAEAGFPESLRNARIALVYQFGPA